MIDRSLYVMLNGFQALTLLGRGVCSPDMVSGASRALTNSINLFKELEYFDGLLNSEELSSGSELIELKRIKVIGEISHDYFNYLNEDLFKTYEDFINVSSIPLFFFKTFYLETPENKSSIFNSIFDNFKSDYLDVKVYGEFRVGNVNKDELDHLNFFKKEDYDNEFYSTPASQLNKDSLLGSLKALLALGQEPGFIDANQIPQIIVNFFKKSEDQDVLMSYINSDLLAFFINEINPKDANLDKTIFYFVALNLLHRERKSRVLNAQLIIESFDDLPVALLDPEDLKSLNNFCTFLMELSIGEVGVHKANKSNNIAMHAILMLLRHQSLDGLIGNARKNQVDPKVLSLSIFLSGLFEGYENMSANYYKGNSQQHSRFSLFSLALDNEEIKKEIISINNLSSITVGGLNASEGFSLTSPHLESVASEFRSSNYAFKNQSKNLMVHEYIFPEDNSRINIYLKLIDDNLEKKHVFRVYAVCASFNKAMKKGKLIELMTWNGKNSSRCKVALSEEQWILCADQLVGTLDGDEVIGMMDDISDAYKQLEILFNAR